MRPGEPGSATGAPGITTASAPLARSSPVVQTTWASWAEVWVCGVTSQAAPTGAFEARS